MLMSRSTIQLIWILAFSATLFLLFNFGLRYINNQRLLQEEQKLRVQVKDARATQTALNERKQYAQTDAFVEDYVRKNWFWGRADDKLVLPASTPAPSTLNRAANNPLPPAPPPENSWWQDLLESIFGQ